MNAVPSLAVMSLAALVLGSAQAYAGTPTPPAPSAAAEAPAADTAAIVAAAFKRADVDGDGRLSSEELRVFPALASRLDDLDRDKDGFVSSEEFAAGVTIKRP